MADVTTLTDDELVNAFAFLAEQAQHITDAQNAIRAEQRRRALIAECDAAGALTSPAADALKQAVAAAPSFVRVTPVEPPADPE